MNRKRTRSEVQNDSRKAVDRAGTRDRRSPVTSAGTWRTQRGKLPEDQDFRPGKTRVKREGRRVTPQ